MGRVGRENNYVRIRLEIPTRDRLQDVLCQFDYLLFAGWKIN